MKARPDLQPARVSLPNFLSDTFVLPVYYLPVIFNEIANMADV